MTYRYLYVHGSNYRKKFVFKMTCVFRQRSAAAAAASGTYIGTAVADEIIYFKRARFRFMVHHHYNQRPFSSVAPRFLLLLLSYQSTPPPKSCVCVKIYSNVCVCLCTVLGLYPRVKLTHVVHKSFSVYTHKHDNNNSTTYRYVLGFAVSGSQFPLVLGLSYYYYESDLMELTH